ncbi:hypothetical protein SAMN02927916_2393 [Flavobacterium anhuiense]|uniref:Uncharacterized protein n=1 Tax=Flavobacterium anhuiense TaxID=459526 RepID=A0ABY0LQW5_9FLAO|nr:hypothetical protein SAMN02927916_2393 [Flavobacterium anhuiense]
MGEACPVENIDIVRWPISSLIYFFRTVFKPSVYKNRKIITEPPIKNAFYNN